MVVFSIVEVLRIRAFAGESNGLKYLLSALKTVDRVPGIWSYSAHTIKSSRGCFDEKIDDHRLRLYLFNFLQYGQSPERIAEGARHVNVQNDLCGLD